MAHTHPGAGLEAFCLTCPQPQEVTRLLEGYGFQLTFHMDAVIYPPSYRLAPIAAQFHYATLSNVEVVYLAGKDANEAEMHLPPHASRFWLYPGRDPEEATRIAQVLALRWALVWQSAQAGEQAA